MSQETVKRLAEIIDGLASLDDAARGEPVRADHWNAVVGAVTELAQLAVSREASIGETLAADFSPVDHSHTGAVDLTWFEPDTRSLIEGGRSDRADLKTDLARTTRDLAAARSEVASLREELRDLQRQFDQLDDRDRNRSRDVNLLSGRVENLGGNTSSIADLRTTLDTIGGRVDEALEFRNELVDPNGVIVDIGVLRSDLDDLLTIRENLTAADGQLVEYRDFEQRLLVLEDRAGQGTGDFDIGAFRAELLAQVADDRTGTVEPLQREIATLGDNVQALDQRTLAADERLTQTESGLSTNTTQITNLQNSTAQIGGLTTRVATAETRINGISQQVAGLDPLRRAVDELGDRFRPIEELAPQFDEFAERLQSTERRLDELRPIDDRLAILEQADVAGMNNRLSEAEAVGVRHQRDMAELADRLTEVQASTTDQQRIVARLTTQQTANQQALRLIGDRLGEPVIDDPFQPFPNRPIPR